jgi:hypothetical protein
MTPHEIFGKMSPGFAAQIFSYLHEKEKALYKATIEALAKPKKIRPVFVERKPRNERHAWMKEALSRKQSDSVSAQILQIWLVGEHSKLLCDFLDGLGIKHDENGTVDELPPAPDKATLLPVIENLLGKYDQELVAVYLQAFQALDENGWPALGEVLQTDERLQPGKSDAVAA